MQREKNEINNIQKLWGNFRKYNTYTLLEYQKEKKEAEKTSEIIIAKNFPKLTTDPRKLRVPISYSDHQKTNTKSESSYREGRTFYLQRKERISSGLLIMQARGE